MGGWKVCDTQMGGYTNTEVRNNPPFYSRVVVQQHGMHSFSQVSSELLLDAAHKRIAILSPVGNIQSPQVLVVCRSQAINTRQSA
jgi:hypothetical protein